MQLTHTVTREVILQIQIGLCTIRYEFGTNQTSQDESGKESESLFGKNSNVCGKRINEGTRNSKER